MKAKFAATVWGITIFFAVAVAGYALAYLVLRERMFPPELADSFRARPWGIYPHALFGAVALFTGALQFRRGKWSRHRALGKVYVLACLLTGGVGLYMAFHSWGGAVTHLGFGGLATTLLVTTVMAFVRIKQRDIAAHRRWMLRSYAMIWAAVMLRIELPLLLVAFKGQFAPAYLIVSWLCWVPNLIAMETYIRLRDESAAIPAGALRV